MDAKTAWPEFFGDPATFVPTSESDLSDFQWESATPESYAKDLEAIMAGSERITLQEDEDPVAPPSRPPTTAPEFEWT